MSTIERRLAALERGAAVAPRATSEPYWSEANSCMMVNNGGFILPVVLTPEAWERKATAEQDALIARCRRDDNGR